MRAFSYGLRLFFLFAFLLSGGNSWAQALKPGPILLKADHLLTPKGSYEYEGSLAVEREGSEAETWRFRAAAHDLNRRRVLFFSPQAERGKSLLADGGSLWLYLPKIKKSVRIPPSTAFVGTISAADLGQPFFSLNYQAVFVEKDRWEGIPAYVLKLIPRSRHSVYTRLRMWVAQENFRPLQVEYYETRNALRKTCRFEGGQDELGAERPLHWICQDPDKPGERTVLKMKNFERKNFDPRVFLPLDGPESFAFLEEPQKSASRPALAKPRPRSR